MIARSPTVWFADVTIDVGSGDGVEVDDPVVNGDGLVGKVAAVTGGSAQVTLIADHSSAVSAKVVPSGVQGVIRPSVGDPDDLILDFIDSTKRVQQGPGGGHRRLARRRGSPRASRRTSRSAKSTEASIVEQEAQQQVHVRPYADLRNLDLVQVLTGGSRGDPHPEDPRPPRRDRDRSACSCSSPSSRQVALFHISPDVLPALVVSLGLLGGSMTGAVAASRSASCSTAC